MHTMEYHSFRKQAEALRHAKIRISLKIIILQTQNVICCMVHLHEISSIGKFIEAESKQVVARIPGRKNRE